MLLMFCIYLCLDMAMSVHAYRTVKIGGANLILAKAGETIDIVCDNSLPLARCGFSHPNGTRILLTKVVPGTPSCKFTTDATSSVIGVWTCHFWTPTAPQEEITKTVEVRVAHKFAALKKEVEVKEGEGATLSCLTSERMVPLNDCYFVSPGHHKIHMNDETSEDNIVLDKYYFPRNMSVHRGDCSITIVAAGPRDAGPWRCYGWLELENREYSDTVLLTVHTDADDNIAGWSFTFDSTFRLHIKRNFVSAGHSDAEPWRCCGWLEVENREYSDTVMLTVHTDADDNIADDGPITINVTTYICGTLGFLIVFTGLVYYKYRHYTKLYGKTWGDDESINSYMMKKQADPTPLVLADHLLVT